MLTCGVEGVDEMKTTLNEILKYNPCSQNSDKGGWGLLLKNLNKTEADDEPLDLITILESNGIQDAVWALRCFDYKDYCLFLADIAESGLHIDYTYNKARRLEIRAIRDYKAGAIKKGELEGILTYLEGILTYYAVFYAEYAAEVAFAPVSNKKWCEIEPLFIKHFKEWGENMKPDEFMESGEHQKYAKDGSFANVAKVIGIVIMGLAVGALSVALISTLAN